GATEAACVRARSRVLGAGGGEPAVVGVHRPAGRVAAELAAGGCAHRRATHQAVAGRQARRVDELDRDVAGQELTAVQADAAAAGEARAVEVIEAGVEDGRAAGAAGGLERRDRVRPEACLRRRYGLARDGGGKIEAVLGTEPVRDVIDERVPARGGRV